MSEDRKLSLEEVESVGSVEALHAAVEAALEAGDSAEVDRLLAIWSKVNRRRRALSSLQAAAQSELDKQSGERQGRKPIEEMSDEEVCAELERLVGRPFTIKR